MRKLIFTLFAAMLLNSVMLCVDKASFGISAVSSAFASSHESIREIGVEELQDIIVREQGKVLVLNFFATWCGPCRMELPSLSALSRQFSRNDVVFISISVDSDMSALKKFLEISKIPYAVYRDTGDISRALNISSIPFTMILDRQGKLIQIHSGLVQESVLSEELKQAARE